MNTFMTPMECKEAWQKVVKCYNETIEENNPEVTLKRIVRELTLAKTKEIFAVISAIKKHDGRIYGTNREYMNNIPFNPACSEWVAENPIRYAGLDDIHTAHIDNIITELRKYEKRNEELMEHGLKMEKDFVAFARKYGFTAKVYAKGERKVTLSAKDTDGKSTVWLTFYPKGELVSLSGNTDHLNLWFYQTRPDMTPEKILEFVRELNEVLEMEKPFTVRQLIDPEDWQEIADVQDAYADERYTGGENHDN